MKPSATLDDLTLSDLKLLQTLLRTASLTSASLTLGWSIPKASHRLSKIREVLGDELFVRSGNSLVPTTRMKELAPRVSGAVDALASLTIEEHYRPEEIDRLFTFEMVDNAAAILLAPVFASIRKKAPGFHVRIRPSVGRTIENFWEGSTDLAFGFDIDRALPGDIYSQELFKSRHVFAMRKDHPLIETLSKRVANSGAPEALPEDLAPYPYASLSLPRWRTLSSNIDIVWKHEIPSPLYIESPYFLVLPHYLLDSDAYALLPAELAHAFSLSLPITYAEGRPEDIRKWNPMILWHSRSQGDFALQWLRSEICRLSRDHAPVPRQTFKS